MIPDIAYKPTFLRHIVDTFLDLTIPASNIAKPAAIHITKKPHIKNNKVLKINAVSSGEPVAEAEFVRKRVEKPNIRNNIKFLLFFRLLTSNYFIHKSKGNLCAN